MTDGVHRNVSRVVEAGALIGLDVVPVRFPEGTKTAVDAANAIGCDVGQIVKSLVFMAPVDPARDDAGVEPMLALCSNSPVR